MRGHSEKMAICRRKAETSPANTLTLDFQAPELRGNESLLFKPLSLWYSVMAAGLTDTCYSLAGSVHRRSHDSLMRWGL